MTTTIWIGSMALLLAGFEFSKTSNLLEWVCNIAGIMLFILWIVLKEKDRRNQRN